MRRSSEMLLWAVATIALAAVTAFLIARKSGAGAGVSDRAEEDFHQWMHGQLVLSEAQHEALEPLERSFEVQRGNLRGELAAAGRELAEAVRKGEPESPEIDAALRRLNGAQAELQRVMLKHFFAMKEHLDPAQAEKLLEWTHDSIVHE